MRGVGLLRNSNCIGSIGIGNPGRFAPFCAFSSSSAGGGSGGGRGRGGPTPSRFDFVASHPVDADERRSNSDRVANSAGVGRGRGGPLPSTPNQSSFNRFVAPSQPSPPQPGAGHGRGGPAHQPVRSGNEQESQSKKPIFFVKDEATGASVVADSVTAVPRQPIGRKDLPENILNVLTGSGRGQPTRKPVQQEVAPQHNRHLRPRQAPDAGRRGDRNEVREKSPAGGRPKMSREEAVKRASGILSRDRDGRGDDGRDGAVRGRGRSRGRGRGKKWKNDLDEDEEGDEDDDDFGLPAGAEEETERFAKAMGPDRMLELTEAFEEVADEVLPDLEEDEYIDAIDTNFKIEMEPEYMFGELEKNPDIDEKPPMPLHEALEKMKPFLMAYEGIESQEEWEEITEELTERLPLLKEIVDQYCGPDRVTAKQQQTELERVAKTIPVGVPDSVKRFTDRAVLSLQSNPGWGFDRKCQFMDKLANEFSKSYRM